MWKDFFSYTKRERTTLIVLTILILILQAVLWTKRYWIPLLPAELQKKHEEQMQIRAFRDSVYRASVRAAEHPSFNRRAYENNLFDFDPNSVDSSTLSRLGFRNYLIHNLLRYRLKGGVFHQPDDLARLYGMSPVFFTRIRPYIRLKVQGASSESSGHSTLRLSPAPLMNEAPVETRFKPESGVSQNSNARFVSEINASDTTSLQMLKGVGRYTANQIEFYKKQLGGFYSLAQLAEIKGIHPETLQRLQAQFAVNSDAIHRLDINTASLEKLRAHPYISFYQAKVMVELRKAKGKIRSLDELLPFKEFTAEDLGRLKWYLTF